jgi:hypothetical protein
MVRGRVRDRGSAQSEAAIEKRVHALEMSDGCLERHAAIGLFCHDGAHPFVKEKGRSERAGTLFIAESLIDRGVAKLVREALDEHTLGARAPGIGRQQVDAVVSRPCAQMGRALSGGAHEGVDIWMHPQQHPCAGQEIVVREARDDVGNRAREVVEE